MSNQFNTFNQISLVLLVVGIPLCLPRDSIRNGFLLVGVLAIVLSIVSFVLNTRNGIRCLYAAAYVIVTVSVFMFSVSQDPFSIFSKQYLVGMLAYVPFTFIALGVLTTKGSFVSRLQGNRVRKRSVVSSMLMSHEYEEGCYGFSGDPKAS